MSNLKKFEKNVKFHDLTKEQVEAVADKLTISTGVPISVNRMINYAVEKLDHKLNNLNMKRKFEE